MRKFDTKVQHLKYKVLREVAREEWNGHVKGAYARYSEKNSSRQRAYNALLRL